MTTHFGIGGQTATAQGLAVGDIFTVTVGVQSPDRGLDSVTAFLNFDDDGSFVYTGSIGRDQLDQLDQFSKKDRLALDS